MQKANSTVIGSMRLSPNDTLAGGQIWNALGGLPAAGDYSQPGTSVSRNTWQMIFRKQVVNRLAQQILVSTVLIYG